MSGNYAVPREWSPYITHCYCGSRYVTWKKTCINCMFDSNVLHTLRKTHVAVCQIDHNHTFCQLNFWHFGILRRIFGQFRQAVTSASAISIVRDLEQSCGCSDTWQFSCDFSLDIYSLLLCKYFLPSVLWHCLLGSRKGIQPVNNWVVGCWHGYLSGARCRLAYGPADATATHCLFSKIQNGFTFLVPAHPGSPGQRAIKRVCV